MSAQALLSSLQQRGWTLGIAESLTGGALTSEVVTVPGASVSLLGGVVAYATPLKHSILGVDDELLRAFGPVHPLVAEQMADGVRGVVSADDTPADVGLSTTGIAGPTSPDGQPVGTVHIAVVTPTGRRVFSHVFAGDRDLVRRQAVGAAIAAALTVVAE